MSVLSGRQADHDLKDGRVFEIDSTTVLRIPVHQGPISDLAVSPEGGRLIVTNYGRHTISIIDTKTGRVMDAIADLPEPSAVAISGADANRAYISTATAGYDAIEIVDVTAGERIASHRVAHSVSDLTVHENFVYASRNGVRGADIAMVDIATGDLEAVELASTPGTTTECLCMSPDGRRLYVGTNAPAGGNLVTIETRTRSDDRRVGGRSRIAGIVELGLPIRDVALSSDGGTAYVASCGPVVGAVLDVIDTRANKIVNTRKIDEITGPLTRMALSADGRRAYLVSDDRITVLCTRTLDVVGEVMVASQPSCVVESPDGRNLYIADHTGVVFAAQIAVPARSALESGATVPDMSVAWMPEFAQREPALA
ncbi:MAG: YncE family protein [Mycobacterium sp.]|uniref:WD40 repeat domain-containing protein n=1 Tax=Mycobacterium sp. TaxID=1785 RepID=UPI001EB85B55|nr:YncE family protein [Mycobacterium sp.]MBV8786486.1 YncE family protein [Mycobacterium sp.]